MTDADNPPDPRLVEDFLLGRLADADAERVAALVAADPRWQVLVQNFHATDPLLDAVRATAGVAAADDAPPLRDLMARLAGLSLSSVATRSSRGEGDTPPPAAPSFLRPAQAPDELGRLAGFRILEVLGKGGMGLVFRAEDVQLRRQVALKVIKPEYAADAHYRERFLREARAAARLQHDHVMPVHQIGEDNGVLFLAMPLLTGQTLEACLARDHPPTVAEQLRIGREMALGLAAAHGGGLIHRDVKPSNVWLESGAPSSGPAAPHSRTRPTESVAEHEFTASWESHPDQAGRVKILDFGLALPAEEGEPLTHSGAVIGTPAYMSPEQADGRTLDARSDLFSLGCVLYRMATGQQPFKRDSVSATLRAVVDHHPPAPHEVAPVVPTPLSDLILRLLAKSPADRPESAAAVAAAVRAIERGDVPTTPRVPAPASRRRGYPVLVTVTVTLLAALVVAPLMIVLWTGPHVPGDTNQAPAPLPSSPPEGSVDVVVWTKTGSEARRMRLTEAGALPLHPGDQFRIEAKVTPKAYLYLFWIDTEGEAAPIYPWEPGRWDTRPTAEAPRDELSLPPREGKGYTINGDKEGMETLLLLARPSRLEEDDAKVRLWFAGIKPQRPVQHARSAVWFENGRVVNNDARRTRAHFEETDIDDPVLRMQELLRERLQPHAAFTTAVSFARLDK